MGTPNSTTSKKGATADTVTTASAITTSPTPATTTTNHVVDSVKEVEDNVVPPDVTEVLVKAIASHRRAAPAFDVIRASFDNTPYTVDSPLTDKPPVLTLACEEPHVDLIEFLLTEMKANPNTPLHGRFGKPALAEIMCEFKKEQSLAGAKALVRAGADPNAAGFIGITPYTKVLETFKTAPLARDMLMVLATKDGLITDMSTIPVPTACLSNHNLIGARGERIYIHNANPLHLAVASENVIGALVMLELGVDPTAKTSPMSDDTTAQDIMKKFTTYDQALYDTIQIIIDDRTQAKRATEIYDGLVNPCDIVVPKDATDELVKAIKKHGKSTPAFDIIRSIYTPDKPYSIDSLLTEKAPILTLACSATQADLIEFLLTEMKANPNPSLYGDFGEFVLVALMSESRWESKEAGDRFKWKAKQCLAGAKALVRAGADPNAVGDTGLSTPYSMSLETFKTAPLAREMLMVLATKDGTITDMSTIPVPTACLLNQGFNSAGIVGSNSNGVGSFTIHEANPLHYAVAQENVIGALVMLELGVDPTAKTSRGNGAQTAQDILKKFVVYDQALYDTIQIIIDDRTQAKKATEIYDGLVAKAIATETKE